jgi:hypothetical protein
MLNSGFCATINYMAKLKEQARIVKKLHNFYGTTGYNMPQSQHIRLVNQQNGGVPRNEFLFDSHIHWSFWEKLKGLFWSKRTRTQRIMDKRSKVNDLFRSCLEDGYIEPVMSKSVINDPQPHELGARVSNLGSDLIHRAGYWEIVQRKYPLTWNATWKAVAFCVTVITTSSVGVYFLIKLGNYIILHILH